jgi:two-component system chemotaxis response regulator CheB
MSAFAWRHGQAVRQAAPAAAARPARYDLIAIVASAGGLKAMERILKALPPDFPVPIALVQHRLTRQPETLARVLSRHTALTVKLAEEGEALAGGTVYLALSNLHLVVDDRRTLHHVDGRKVRHVLSSGNMLFESAAAALGARVIAVVLTGYDSDGTDGVQAVKRAGGVVLVQDEASCDAFGMPRSAIETGCVDQVLPLEAIGPELVRLASG